MSQTPHHLLYQELLITHARLEVRRRLARYFLTHEIDRAADVAHYIRVEVTHEPSAEQGTTDVENLSSAKVSERLDDILQELENLQAGEEQLAASYGLSTHDLFTIEAIRPWGLLVADHPLLRWLWLTKWDEEADSPMLPYNAPIP